MHWLGISESNFESLWLLVVITNLSTLLPLPFLGWLPVSDPQTEIQPNTIQPVPALELDSTASKHMGQPFLPDLISELVPQSHRVEVEKTAE